MIELHGWSSTKLKREQSCKNWNRRAMDKKILDCATKVSLKFGLNSV